MQEKITTSVERNRWWLIVPTALVVLIINVAIHVLYMVVYSYVIDPGHEEAYYHAYARLSAPYSSIVAGIPVMFLAGRWIGKRFPKENGVKAAVLVWLVYFLIDIAVLFMTGALAGVALLFVISFITKFAAVFLGGLSAQKRGALRTG